MKVLLGAHTIDPLQGGEGGIGWWWAESLARHPRVEQVDVVAHPMARHAIEQRLCQDGVLGAKLRFHWVLPPDGLDPWKGNVPGKKVWHRLLLHYQLWQRAAERTARLLASNVDVAHHVTFGSIHLRTFVTSLSLPYIIGPVGGGQAASLLDAVRLFGNSRDVHGGLEVIRSLIIGPMGRRPVMKGRLGRAYSVLCANSQTLRLARRYQQRSELMIDGGLGPLTTSRSRLPGGAPIILWVGKLEARKDPLAALDVAERLRVIVPEARLLVVGDGWLENRVREEIMRRSLSDTVQLAGRIPHEQMEDAYTSASLFLFTSLRDTFGVQNLEAMTYGLPIVFRDSHGVGVGDFAGAAALGIPNGPGWAAEAARSIAKLLRDPEDWQRRSTSALTLVKTYTWAAKAERAVTLYEEAVRSRGR